MWFRKKKKAVLQWKCNTQPFCLTLHHIGRNVTRFFVALNKSCKEKSVSVQTGTNGLFISLLPYLVFSNSHPMCKCYRKSFSRRINQYHHLHENNTLKMSKRIRLRGLILLALGEEMHCGKYRNALWEIQKGIVGNREMPTLS